MKTTTRRRDEGGGRSEKISLSYTTQQYYNQFFYLSAATWRKRSWLDILNSSQQIGIFVIGRTIPCYHYVSLLCSNVYDVSSYYETFFYIVTPYVSATVRNQLIVQFHETCTILCILPFYHLQYHNLFNSFLKPSFNRSSRTTCLIVIFQFHTCASTSFHLLRRLSKSSYNLQLRITRPPCRTCVPTMCPVLHQLSLWTIEFPVLYCHTFGPSVYMYSSGRANDSFEWTVVLHMYLWSIYLTCTLVFVIMALRVPCTLTNILVSQSVKLVHLIKYLLYFIQDILYYFTLLTRAQDQLHCSMVRESTTAEAYRKQQPTSYK